MPQASHQDRRLTAPAAAAGAEPVPVTIDHDGLRITALDWGGRGTPLVLLHPNGFCAGLFDPIARLLSASGSWRPVGVDLRGHGGSAVPMPLGSGGSGDGLAFAAMASDVVAVLDHLGIDDAVAVGASLGGGVAVLVDEQRPGLLRRLMLCEAIAFASHPRPERPIERAALARRRTATWPDRETMLKVYGARAPLSELAPEALAGYAQWGAVDNPDGTVRLACDPETEAAIFEMSGQGGAAAAWDHLAHLHARASVLAGDASFLPLELFEAQASRAGRPLEVIAGGHFFLFADTRRATDLISTHLT